MSDNKNHSNKVKLSFRIPWFIRKGFYFLYTIHPKWGRDFALFLFFRPLRFPMPDREKKPANRAKKYRLEVNKQPIKVYKWGNGKRKILCVHGWSGRGTQFFKIAKRLVKDGFQVISFDAPGHGIYPNNTSDLFQFVAAIRIIEEKMGPFYGGMGHSLGGVALMNAHAQGVNFDKIVIVASPSTIWNSISDFTLRLEAPERLAFEIREKLEEKYQLNLDDFSLKTLASKNHRPSLIIHDENDLDVSVQDAKDLYKVWKSSSLLITQGLGHRKVLMDKSTIKTISNFYKKRNR